MPTQHVGPQSEEHLDHVSMSLSRARKVVVITGAGISTNSGIPDFRSENGLYSLVQAQFDAVARQPRRVEPVVNSQDCRAGNEPRPTKRRKLFPQDSAGFCRGHPEQPKQGQTGSSGPEHLPSNGCQDADSAPSQPDDGAGSAPQSFSTPRLKPALIAAADITTSPLSSPPPEDLLVTPSTFLSIPNQRFGDVALPQSSSPLSSPPPALFDSLVPSSPSAAISSRRSSTSESDVGSSNPASNSLSSSQTSSCSRSSLPNMKGKDLFDASIWSDPTRTSVFYTFATSLRQKIKAAEPSSSHRFISHLRDRGKLVRCYTQNIDQIEEKVGLSTCLLDGPGSRGRFSRRSTATTNQLNKMVEEAAAIADEPLKSDKQSQSDDQSGCDSTQPSQVESATGTAMAGAEGETVATGLRRAPARLLKRDLPRSGVECVFLHGSLELLRCFLCGRVCSWDDDEREAETMTGQQPECPHCAGATAAREEKGKRALGVGKLRPDIVLYGEEHPSAHLISPIVTHDLALQPDMMLILGTSLRVHGLKVMVREFAKAVHSKGGKVVFVNFTKPPESSWGDVIDYWVQWDCDAWVADLQGRVPHLWQDHGHLPRTKKKRQSGETAESRRKEKKQSAAKSLAFRDTKDSGAYWTKRVLQALGRITARGVSMVAGELAGQSNEPEPTLRKRAKAKSKPSRKSAPGALEKSTQASSLLEPAHSMCKTEGGQAAEMADASVDNVAAVSSILTSVKQKPRIRKRKVIDGEEVAPPRAPRRRGFKTAASDLKLPPLRSPPAQQTTLPYMYGRPEPMEPRSPPAGPLASLSPNLRSVAVPGVRHGCVDNLRGRQINSVPSWPRIWDQGGDGSLPPVRSERSAAETRGACGFKEPGAGGPDSMGAELRQPSASSLEGNLMNWGASWSCRQ